MAGQAESAASAAASWPPCGAPPDPRDRGAPGPPSRRSRTIPTEADPPSASSPPFNPRRPPLPPAEVFVCPPIGVDGSIRSAAGIEVAGVSTSRRVRPSGSSRRQVASGMTAAASAVEQRTEARRSPPSISRRTAGPARWAGRRAAAAGGRPRARGPRRRSGVASGREHRPPRDPRRGMSPPTTTGRVAARVAVSPAEQSGQRSLEARPDHGRPARRPGRSGGASGATTTTTSPASGRRPRSRGTAGGGRRGRRELVAPEPRRRPPGEHDRADGRRRPAGSARPPAVGHRADAPATVAARGPGTCPSGRRRIPRRSRSVEDRHHVLAAGAGRVAQAAGVSGAAPASDQRGRLDRPIRGRGLGEARLEHDDPPAAIELADAVRRTAGGAGRVGEVGRRRDRRGRLEAVHRRARAASGTGPARVADPVSLSAAPPATRRPSATRRRPRARAARGQRSSGRVRWRRRRSARGRTVRAPGASDRRRRPRAPPSSAASATSGARRRPVPRAAPRGGPAEPAREPTRRPLQRPRPAPARSASGDGGTPARRRRHR